MTFQIVAVCLLGGFLLFIYIILSTLDDKIDRLIKSQCDIFDEFKYLKQINSWNDNSYMHLVEIMSEILNKLPEKPKKKCKSCKQDIEC